MDAVPNLKLCCLCCRTLPEAEFRFRSKSTGRRMHQCRECTTTAQRERRHARKTHTTKRAMGKLTQQLAQTADAKRVARLVSDSIDQLGGLHRFAAAYREHFDAVSIAQPGRRETLNALIAIANLSVASATLNPPPDPRLMQDDDLAEYVERLLDQKMIERLEQALPELIAQGWVIMAPEVSDATTDAN